MTLRNEIAALMRNGVDGDDYDWIEPTYDIADAILALVREALTREEAVQAACMEYWRMENEDTHWDGIVRSITAALDTVTGDKA